MATEDVAIGSFEAAALLGVHWTRPRRMAEKGWIEARQLKAGRGDRAYSVYSLASCEKDLREYEDRVAAHGGYHERRPRAWLHLRPAMQKRLAKGPQIAFSDACSVADAMAIMRLVSTAQITLLVRKGEIVARKAYNPRQAVAGVGAGSGLWIISRRSCEERQRRIVAAEAAGKKPGIRKWVKKKTAKS